MHQSQQTLDEVRRRRIQLGLPPVHPIGPASVYPRLPQYMARGLDDHSGLIASTNPRPIISDRAVIVTGMLFAAVVVIVLWATGHLGMPA